jgi:hypothetical protein
MITGEHKRKLYKKLFIRTNRGFRLLHYGRKRANVKIQHKNVSHTETHTSSTQVKSNVKVTLVKALRLCTGRTAHRGSRSIALLFHDHGTKRG